MRALPHASKASVCSLSVHCKFGREESKGEEASGRRGRRGEKCALWMDGQVALVLGSVMASERATIAAAAADGGSDARGVE